MELLFCLKNLNRNGKDLNMKGRFKLLLIASLGLLLVVAGCASNDNGEETTDSQKEIIIGLDPYDYATVPAYLSKEILEREGYDATIQEGEVGILYEALAGGDIDVYIDIWAPNLQKNYLEEYEGQFDVIGTLYSGAPVGLAVPEFMDHITTTEDLETYKDEFNQMIYAVEAGSGMDHTTRRLIDEYSLDYDVTNSSTPAMITQAQRMIDNNEAIVFNAWRPHTMFQLLDIKMIEDPKDIWGSDDVQVGAVLDLQEKAPEAYTLYSNMEFTLDEIEEWLLQMELDGKEPAELAKEWVDNNEDRVNEWLEK